MDYDNYIINDGTKDIIIYTLLEFDHEGKRYIVYKNNINDKTMYIGEIINKQEIIPVKEEKLQELENIIKETYKTIEDKLNN